MLKDKPGFWFGLTILLASLLTGCTENTSPTTPITPGSNVSSNSIDLASLTDLQEVQLDPATADEVSKTFSNNNIGDASLHYYSSDSDPTAVMAETDQIILAEGYHFALASYTGPINQNGMSVGMYSKTSAPDIVAGAVSTNNNPDFQNGNTKALPGLSLAETQKVLQQLRTKKTALVVFAGSGLLKSMIPAGSPLLTPQK